MGLFRSEQYASVHCIAWNECRMLFGKIEVSKLTFWGALFRSRIHRKWKCSSAKDLSIWPFISSHFLVFWDKLCWHFVWRVMHINLIISKRTIRLTVSISISTDSDYGSAFRPFYKLTACVKRISIISRAAHYLSDTLYQNRCF